MATRGYTSNFWSNFGPFLKIQSGTWDFWTFFVNSAGGDEGLYVEFLVQFWTFDLLLMCREGGWEWARLFVSVGIFYLTPPHPPQPHPHPPPGPFLTFFTFFLDFQERSKFGPKIRRITPRRHRLNLQKNIKNPKFHFGF